MAVICPASDLTDYNTLLNRVSVGNPVYITIDGRGRYSIRDITEDDEFEKAKALLQRMNESRYNSNDSEKSKRNQNLVLLSDIKWEESDEEDHVTDKVIDKSVNIILHIVRQPELFRTRENSIQMQFEKDDLSYLEFEVFEDTITCMIVPQRDYEKADFPEINEDYVSDINMIVGEFYDPEMEWIAI